MKLEINAGVFGNALKKALPYTEGSVITQTVSSYFLLRHEGRELSISASNGVAYYKTQIALEQELFDEKAEVLVAANELTQLVNSFANKKMLTLTFMPKSFKINSDKSNYSIGSLGSDEFYNMKPLTELNGKMPHAVFLYAELLYLLQTVEPYVVEKMHRAYKVGMAGMKLEMKGERAVAIATNSHYLCIATANLIHIKGGSEYMVHIPAEVFRYLKNSFVGEQVTLYFRMLKDEIIGMYIEDEDSLLYYPLLSNNFVPYEQITPRQYAVRAVMDVEVFKEAVKRVALVGENTITETGQYRVIDLTKKGRQLTVKTLDSETGSGVEVIEAHGKGNWSLSLHSGYILKILDNIGSDKVIFGIGSDLRITAFTSEIGEPYMFLTPFSRQQEKRNEEGNITIVSVPATIENVGSSDYVDSLIEGQEDRFTVGEKPLEKEVVTKKKPAPKKAPKGRPQPKGKFRPKKKGVK